MKLYEVPRMTRIRVTNQGGMSPTEFTVKLEQEFMFHHIDGMYSYCVNDRGDVVHLPVWAEVDIV